MERSSRSRFTTPSLTRSSIAGPGGLARSDQPIGPVAHQITVGRSVDDGLPGRGSDRVESELALFTSERLAGPVAVHAAVIVHGSKALVVPGTSGAGKSTLCVAAAAAGADVLSDEYALVDPTTGLVTGWRRPVRVRRPGGGVDRLDIAAESDPVPVGWSRSSTTSAMTQSRGPRSAARRRARLLANTVCARSRPDEALDAALAVAHPLRPWRDPGAKLHRPSSNRSPSSTPAIRWPDPPIRVPPHRSDFRLTIGPCVDRDRSTRRIGDDQLLVEQETDALLRLAVESCSGIRSATWVSVPGSSSESTRAPPPLAGHGGHHQGRRPVERAPIGAETPHPPLNYQGVDRGQDRGSRRGRDS